MKQSTKKGKYTEAVHLYLTRIKASINRGEYDAQLTIPFASKELLYNRIVKEVDTNILHSRTPMLTKQEIEKCINDVLYTAISVNEIYIKVGILKKNDDNTYEVTSLGKKLLKTL